MAYGDQDGDKDDYARGYAGSGAPDRINTSWRMGDNLRQDEEAHTSRQSKIGSNHNRLPSSDDSSQHAISGSYRSSGALGSIRSGSRSTLFQKIKTGAAYVFVIIPGTCGVISGAIDSGADDMLNPFKSGASAFRGSYRLTSGFVDGFTQDEKGKPSSSLGAESTKVGLGYFGVVGFAGAFVGNLGTTAVTHVVWPACKFTWNRVVVPAASYIGDHIPDEKSSTAAPEAAPPKPQLPETRTKVSYRVDHKNLG